MDNFGLDSRLLVGIIRGYTSHIGGCRDSLARVVAHRWQDACGVHYDGARLKVCQPEDGRNGANLHQAQSADSSGTF